MATWYFDAVNGSNANPGTIDLPKQTWDATGTAPGDTFLFKRGVEQIVTTPTRGIRSGSSDTVRSRFGAYGEAQVPYSIWKYGAPSGNMILNGQQAKYIDFEDMYFDMRNSNCRNSVYCASQGANPTIGVAFRRCYFQGSNTPVTHGGSGLNIAREPSATALPQNYVIEDCHFFDNDSHGLFLQGVQGVIVRRSKFYRNGAHAPTGGHGFSAGANNTSVTSGWSNVSGTIYSRALGASELAVYYVNVYASAYPHIRLTSGSQTAPGVGEFGVSGTTLYLNINANPNGQMVNYAWGKCGGIIVEDCESYDNYWDQSAMYHEGHGFAFDDYSDDSQFLRNLSYNNQGGGFSINRGDRNLLRGNVAYGNWQAGLVANPNDGLNACNNTFFANNAGPGKHDAEIKFNGYCKDAIISNNILLPTVSYGISRETTDTGFTGTKNCIYGHAVAVEKNASVTGTINMNPKLDSSYRPCVAELIRTGANLGGKDFYGKQFYDSPNIGAVDDVSATPRYSFKRPKST
jgi:hypothetical protein